MDRRGGRFGKPADHIPVRRGLTLTSSPRARQAFLRERLKLQTARFLAFREKQRTKIPSELPEGGREPVTIPNETVSCGFCGALVFQTGYFRAHSRPDGSACSPGIPLTIRY